MLLIHEQSYNYVKSELNLFSVLLTQTSVEQGRLIEYGPIFNIDNHPIEFKISPSENLLSMNKDIYNKKHNKVNDYETYVH